MIALYTFAVLVVLWLGILFFLRKVWFYRDPQRTAEGKFPSIISPADGRVVYIKRFSDGKIAAEKLGETIPLDEIGGTPGVFGNGIESSQDPNTLMRQGSGWAIGIYMSPLDVHFNYCPLPGKVEHIFRKSASVNFPMLDLWEYIRVVWFRKMVTMFARRYHLENERNTIFMDCNGLKMAVVLIADKFVAKIRCYVKEEETLGYSQKLGFIERGSQVDLILFTEDIDFTVGINDQVYGGKTVIAVLKGDV